MKRRGLYLLPTISKYKKNESSKQIEDASRHGTLEHLELEVLADDDAIRAEHGLDRLARQLRVVVLFREMAEPYIAQVLAHVLRYGFATEIVVQMARTTGDTALQMLWVRPMEEHLTIVVGLDDQIVGPRDISRHLVCDATTIRHDTETHTFGLNHVAYIVAAVVRDTEWRHKEITDGDGLRRFQITTIGSFHLSRDAIVAIDPLVDGFSGIDRQMLIMAKAADTLDVVSMIVSDQHMVHLCEA